MTIRPRTALMALVAALALSPMLIATSVAQEAAKPAKFTLDGDTAVWTVAIRADKTADFEQLMGRLQAALAKSSNPERREQAAGWRVVRLSAPLPDGNVAYVHLVRPVVAGADYTVMQILYDEFPDEARGLYDLYKGAFAKNLSLAVGKTAVDMSAPAPSIAGR